MPSEKEKTFLLKVNQHINMCVTNKQNKDKCLESILLLKEEAELFIKSSYLQEKIIKMVYGYIYIKTLLLKSVMIEPSLSEIIFLSDHRTILSKYKEFLFENGYYKYFDLNKIKDLNLLMSYIEASDPSDVDKFIEHEDTNVRLAAFKKKGYLSCASLMAKDPSPIIRREICHHVPFDHEVLSYLKNDKSKKVFEILIEKINTDELPMLMGSTHLKDPDIARKFKNRLSSIGVS